MARTRPSTRVSRRTVSARQAANDARATNKLRAKVVEAVETWLKKYKSNKTRENYAMDLAQFLDFIRAPIDELEYLIHVRPNRISAWRDHLFRIGLADRTVLRKLTTLQSLYSFLHRNGHLGVNPAHRDFVDYPKAPREGATVGLSGRDCRRILDAPDASTPVGLRDRALLAVLAYSGCRVGELVKLRSCDFRWHLGHRVLELQGKGRKPRRIGLHPEAVERLAEWLKVSPRSSGGPKTPIFRPPVSSRGGGKDGFKAEKLSARGVEYLVERYVRKLGLDPAVTVHSFRVTALTNASEEGADLPDLQDFAGHADPRTTLTYIRSKDRLKKSPSYKVKI